MSIDNVGLSELYLILDKTKLTSGTSSICREMIMMRIYIFFTAGMPIGMGTADRMVSEKMFYSAFLSRKFQR